VSGIQSGGGDGVDGGGKQDGGGGYGIEAGREEDEGGGGEQREVGFIGIGPGQLIRGGVGSESMAVREAEMRIRGLLARPTSSLEEFEYERENDIGDGDGHGHEDRREGGADEIVSPVSPITPSSQGRRFSREGK